MDPEPGEPTWVGDVLRYWFRELSEQDWWDGDDAVDAAIRVRFLPLHERLAQDARIAAAPRPMLAAVIVLDQFSRHLFRGSPHAYAADAAARRLSRDAIAQGLDNAMIDEERMFLYMPFQHSEDPADQATSLELFAALGNANWTHHARQHKQIIDRFGRFPHRNAVLGRASTPDELALLNDPSNIF